MPSVEYGVAKFVRGDGGAGISKPDCSLEHSSSAVRSVRVDLGAMDKRSC
jgi:hypothetical protein